jgi:hypothetical protein
MTKRKLEHTVCRQNYVRYEVRPTALGGYPMFSIIFKKIQPKSSAHS